MLTKKSKRMWLVRFQTWLQQIEIWIMVWRGKVEIYTIKEERGVSLKQAAGKPWRPERVVVDGSVTGSRIGCNGEESGKIIVPRWDKGGSNDWDENSCWNTGIMCSTGGGSNWYGRGKDTSWGSVIRSIKERFTPFNLALCCQKNLNLALVLQVEKSSP